MAGRKTVKTAEHEALAARSPEQYGRFSKGDPVKVKSPGDKSEKFIRGSFRFMYATLNSTGEAESFTVYGGLGGRGATRTFTPDRIVENRKMKRLQKVDE